MIEIQLLYRFGERNSYYFTIYLNILQTNKQSNRFTNGKGDNMDIGAQNHSESIIREQ